MPTAENGAESWFLTDCPRDAMQGLKRFIPTEDKVEYLSLLMEVGFDVLDAGSFVSHKAVPQMRDTAAVLSALPETSTKILAVVANERGCHEALDHGRPQLIGFPFSISETFQQRNTGAGIEEGWRRLDAIRNATSRMGRDLVVYLSMGFGNPYGDPWNPELAAAWSLRLHEELEVTHLALSDTIGAANPGEISRVCNAVKQAVPHLELGAHLHGRQDAALELMEAAWHAGCRNFDGALGGYGGCPMAKDELVGNLPTEILMHAPEHWGGMKKPWNQQALADARSMLSRIY